MKKLLLLCISLFIIASCSVDDDSNTVQFHMDFMGVQDVEIADYFERGQEYEVKVFYIKPTDCHYFQGFYYYPDGYTHTIAPQAMVLENDNCQPFETLMMENESFTFPCPNTYAYDKYVFRFYEGEDEMGNQLFREITVPIIN